jgi:hypothetical protein
MVSESQSGSSGTEDAVGCEGAAGAAGVAESLDAVNQSGKSAFVLLAGAALGVKAGPASRLTVSSGAPLADAALSQSGVLGCEFASQSGIGDSDGGGAYWV